MTQAHHQHTLSHPGRQEHALGLSISSAGFTLVPLTTTFTPGRQARFAFYIEDPNGHPVRTFDEQHEALLHLIVVRRDLAHFQHLHPDVSPDSTCSVALTLPEAGFYRAFTDFMTGGMPLTLGSDLAAAGDLRLTPPAAPSSIARAGLYEIALLTDVSQPDVPGTLAFEVRQSGGRVRDLQRYLGALGHLVILREGDLAYLHAHPTDSVEDQGASMAFHVTFPSGGRYRLFLQFAHAHHVHTAEFVVNVARNPEPSTT